MSLGNRLSAIVCGCATFVTGLLSASAAADLLENEVLLVYNSLDPTSSVIRDKYIESRPNVYQFDLQIDYSLHVPADPNNPGPDDITEFYITPEAFVTYIADPLNAHIPSLPDEILAIATTRGLPAVVTLDFNLIAADQNHDCDTNIVGSLEAELSVLGSIVDPSDTLGCGIANPYKDIVNLPFRDFLADSCHVEGGADLRGIMYLACRLDSSQVDGSYLKGVGLMIRRSNDPTVNKFGVTQVYDNTQECQTTVKRIAARAMCEEKWCVVYDNSPTFLHGVNQPIDPGCGAWEEAVEGQYTDWPELLHTTIGRNQQDDNCELFEPVCNDYVQYYNAHPAGLFISIESWNGWKIHTPGSGGHGNVLDWIAAGGSFAIGNTQGPSTAPSADNVALNLYHYGMSWAEAAYSSMPTLGQHLTPIGDPLATVRVFNPDLNDDGAVDAVDLALQLDPDTEVDINQDGVIDLADTQLILDVLGRDCSGQVCESMPLADFTETEFTVCYSLALGLPDYHCQGDLDGDLILTLNDKILLIDRAGCECSDIDLDGDGIVNQGDVIILDDLIQNSPDLLAQLADVNNDGEWDCDDVVIIGFGHPAYDFNCDGVTNVTDANLVRYFRDDPNGDGFVDCEDIVDMIDLIDTGGYDIVFDMNCDGVLEFFDCVALKDTLLLMHGIQCAEVCPLP